jgi:predicted alpha/beta superfamily hydrolase
MTLTFSTSPKETGQLFRTLTVALWALLVLSAFPAYAQLDSIPNTLEKAFLLPSAVMPESRSIWVHLPANYTTTTHTYPVLYVLDAGTQFKYSSAVADYLAGYDRNRIPDLIVVGIPNVDRGRDFTPLHPTLTNGKIDSSTITETAGAATFLRFLQQELVPFIDQHYRTQPYRLLVGHSLGGLFAFYAKMKAPTLFPATILISPAITGVNEKLLTDFTPFLTQHPHLNGKLFVALGNENAEKVDLLTQQLRTAAPTSLQWRYQHYADENHFSVTAKSIGDALKFIYTNWFIDFYASTPLFYNDIQSRFARLSREFGYSMEPTEEFINNCGYTQLRSHHTAQAIELFEQNVKHFPASANAHDSLGEAYLAQGKKSLAIKSYQKSLTLDPHNENARTILKQLRGSPN